MEEPRAADRGAGSTAPHHDGSQDGPPPTSAGRRAVRLLLCGAGGPWQAALVDCPRRTARLEGVRLELVDLGVDAIAAAGRLRSLRVRSGGDEAPAPTLVVAADRERPDPRWLASLLDALAAPDELARGEEESPGSERLAASEAAIRAAAARTAAADARSRSDPPVAAPLHVVLLSSAEVHAPSHKHLGMVGEEALAVRGDDDPRARRWRRLEKVAEEGCALAGSTLTVLRPAWTPVAGAPDFASRIFTGRAAWTFPGHDPVLQVLAPMDLARAVLLAAQAPLTGVFHLVPDGALHLRKALRAAGVRRLVAPWWLQTVARRLSGRDRQRAAAERLRYSWTASGERSRELLGFVARCNSWEALNGLRDDDDGDRDTGPMEVSDPFGEDREYIGRFQRTLWRYLHDVHWRVEEHGVEHLPYEGRAVLVGIHRGLMPWDGVMLHSAVQRHRGRFVRFLIHPSLIKMPFLYNYMTKIGGMPACQENAARVLEEDGLLGIFPEGIRGAFTYYRDAYELKRFGRDEYVRMALRHRAPLVPFVTVGSAEIFPIVAKIDWTWWRRYSEWPTLPIAPPFPLLPIPLPTKWHTRFLEPLPVHEQYGPEAADDREIVAAISLEVQQRMRVAWHTLRARRRHLFRGGLDDAREAAERAR